MPTLNCLFCNQLFYAKPSHVSRRKYCSKKCMDDSRKKHTLRNCLTCQKQFKYYNWQRKKYCSHKCRPRNGNSKKPICPGCKKEHKNYTKYCTSSCYYNVMKGIEKPSKWEIMTWDEQIIQLKKSYEKYVIKNENGCWDWKGTKSKPYGSLQFGGKYKTIGAHQASWIIHFGKIPKGMFVCHHCDNPPCSNPMHLFLGTPRDNVLDMIKKGRANYIFGENHIQSKLNAKDIIQIKKLIRIGIKQEDIALKYKISRSVISQIKHNKIWKHLKFKDTE